VLGFYGGGEINAAVNLGVDGGYGFISAIHSRPLSHHHTHRIQMLMAAFQTPEDPVEIPPAEPENIRLLLAHYHQTQQARLDEAKARLRTKILPALRSHRVANIEAAYSGYGDSGCIDGIQYRDEAGVRVDRNSLPAPVIEQLETCIYEFLPSGFEIKDGGQGTLTLDVQTGKVTLAHQENYTETRDSTREFDL
jgi:hypothetical protein